MEQQTEQNGVETGAVAPATPTTQSVVGNNVETICDDAAAATNREEFESEGEEQPTEQTGVETGVVAPATPTTQSVVSKNV